MTNMHPAAAATAAWTVSEGGVEASSGSSPGVGGATSTVFGFAPFFAFASAWHCRHPDAHGEQSSIQVTGPHKSEEVRCDRDSWQTLHASSSEQLPVPVFDMQCCHGGGAHLIPEPYLTAFCSSRAQVFQLYKNRQMKGSNLVVGLASSDVQCQDIPPAFFRTLSYLFELAKSGATYRPVTLDDLAAGKPAQDWCGPLWCMQPQRCGSHEPEFAITGRCSSGGGASELSSSADVGPSTVRSVSSLASRHSSPCCSVHSDGSDPLHALAQDDAVPAALQALEPSASQPSGRRQPSELLFSSAPFWCYLYSHEPARAKKTPPKTAEQMVMMLRTGCLPEWTPIIGLEAAVSTYNSLPPSLFMPLASLLHLSACGLPYRAVSQAELTQWDKFKDTRSASGVTQGGVQAAASGGGAAPSERRKSGAAWRHGSTPGAPAACGAQSAPHHGAAMQTPAGQLPANNCSSAGGAPPYGLMSNLSIHAPCASHYGHLAGGTPGVVWYGGDEGGSYSAAAATPCQAAPGALLMMQSPYGPAVAYPSGQAVPPYYYTAGPAGLPEAGAQQQQQQVGPEYPATRSFHSFGGQETPTRTASLPQMSPFHYNPGPPLRRCVYLCSYVVLRQ